MPTYDYRCDNCSHEFEEFQYIKDEPLKKCPACGKNKLKRLIGGGAAIVFKGSGFYQTDYRSESYRKSAKADSPAGREGSAAPATGSGTAKKETPKTDSSKTGTTTT